ncbi:MFS transporter [Actinophytocola sp.]|uniref:MFS transporter n=1 Tax=Actinophytocola sp. TaxID=1872138 RepID=UPI002EDA534B
MGRDPPAWAPLRRSMFRALWLAQFAGNVGTWAQTVGAQWLMGDLSTSELAVALVQVATTLPVFLLVLPAGSLGDIVDRRRLLLAGQTLMFLGAGTLAALTAAHTITPASLLALIALMGVGQALCVPTFQAIQPELVDRDEIADAALLNGVNFNVARAVGPALGGLLIATVGPAATFALNATSFLAVLAVLVRWRRPQDRRPLGVERLRAAIRAGRRYVGSAPRFATVLVRSALFMVFASGLWALLPALARYQLRLDAGGYGLLLASVGLGAVLGAFGVPRLRERIGTDAVVSWSGFAYAVAMAVTGLTSSTAVAVVALLVTGVAWIAVQATLNASAQVLLPAWTRARALAYFQLVFMGGQALGGLGWGLLADLASLRAAFVVAAAALAAVTAVSMRVLPLGETGVDVSTARHWPEPVAETRPDPTDGPVLVIAEWSVPPENAAAFVRAMRPVGRARRRTGATSWGLYQDVANPTAFVETFTVATWEEHLRQHYERGTAVDGELEAYAYGLTANAGEPHVRHLIRQRGFPQ